MKDRTKALLVGTGAAVTAMSALTAGTYALSSKLLHMALDRQLPRGMEKNRARLTGEASDYPLLTAKLNAAAQKLQGCATVELTARDGTRLVGHWYENPNPRRIVIAMHGWRSRWDQDFGFISPFLQEAGCSVLYAEQRGQNASGGRHITFGLLEHLDCLDWVAWASAHTVPGLPVYLAGISMGATTVLLAAGQPLPEQVKGIIADCGFTSPHAIWKHVAEQNLHLNYSLHHGWVERLCKRRLHLSPKNASTVEAMKKCRVPVLFVHGSDDAFVPVEMTYENYKACGAPKTLLIVPGAGHGMSYLQETRRYQQTLSDFWKKYDG